MAVNIRNSIYKSGIQYFKTDTSSNLVSLDHDTVLNNIDHNIVLTNIDMKKKYDWATDWISRYIGRYFDV